MHQQACITTSYEAQQEIKFEAMTAERQASLKELKQTKEHERKCITKMFTVESEAWVNAAKAEGLLRLEVSRSRLCFISNIRLTDQINVIHWREYLANSLYSCYGRR